MRISSSTASTLAMPARKIAWLSARISLSMLSALQKVTLEKVMLRKNLRLPHEFIRVNHAGHAFAVRARSCRIGADNPAFALNRDALSATGDVGRQRDLELHRRTYFERCVGANINSRRAQISCRSLGVATRALFMYLDRQFQRKSFSGPRFGHSASSFVARPILAKSISLGKCHSHQNTLLTARSTTIPAHGRYITDETAIKA